VSDLEIQGLHASIDGKEILKGIDLELSRGEIHAVMGPNGSGKSTLANVLMGHPAYEVTAGTVHFKGIDLLELEPDERSRLGVFLAFQYPHAVPGVTVSSFMRQVMNAHRRGGHDGTDDPISVKDFAALLRSNMELLEVDRSMAGRYLNDGFSGGEKKRLEILQMA
jgi:Fe-S cluster assembly ATP-binding protein